MARMEPVIMELERKETVVVVGHQAVLRFFNYIKIWSPITLSIANINTSIKKQLVTKQFSGFNNISSTTSPLFRRCLLGYLLEVDEEHMPWLEVFINLST